jgi:LPXTG-site transpeptidase (sortase) family protein
MKRNNKTIHKRKTTFKSLSQNNIFRQLLVLTALILLFLTVNYFNKVVIQDRLRNITLSTNAIGAPVRLVIPKIKVNAPVQHIGITQQNSMETPNNATDVGWLKIGTKPGEKGSTVIDGHFDNEMGGKGVFNDLHQLTKGDRVLIKTDKGETFTYIVNSLKVYDEGTKAPEIFSKNDGKYLSLITCDGIWNETTKSYTQRLVVFAALAK